MIENPLKIQAEPSTVLSARGLEYAYPGGHEAVRGVDIEVFSGEKVALLGPNGAGKSTLLLMLNGCLTPSGGVMEIMGTRIPNSLDDPIERRRGAEFARKSVGLLFQEPDDQLFMSTVEEDLRCGPAGMGLTEDEINEWVDSAAEAAGIGHIRNRVPQNLSGGEKKAVALATVLAMRPSILVLDEPTDRLDPAARSRLLKTLGSMKGPMLVATHDLWAAMELCGRSLLMKEGRIVAEGPSREILTDPVKLAEAGLEPPPGMELCPLCAGRLADTAEGITRGR